MSVGFRVSRSTSTRRTRRRTSTWCRLVDMCSFLSAPGTSGSRVFVLMDIAGARVRRRHRSIACCCLAVGQPATRPGAKYARPAKIVVLRPPPIARAAIPAASSASRPPRDRPRHAWPSGSRPRGTARGAGTPQAIRTFPHGTASRSAARGEVEQRARAQTADATDA
jgi:hypothetical protein